MFRELPGLKVHTLELSNFLCLAGPDTISEVGSLQDYTSLAQRASNPERTGAVKDAAHSASLAVQDAVQRLPDRSDKMLSTLQGLLQTASCS